MRFSGSACRKNFYPRSPCGERPLQAAFIFINNGISIHALLAESDHDRLQIGYAADHISIHALLAESDTQNFCVCVIQLKFLSTLSLRRATSLLPQLGSFIVDFYPRSPCGERPWQRGSRVTYVEISIHALLAESDRISSPMSPRRLAFLSTLSLRRATDKQVNAIEAAFAISIHALLAESDLAWFRPAYGNSISIHALLAESDSKSAQNSGALLRI